MTRPSIADLKPTGRVWSCATGQNCRPRDRCCDSCRFVPDTRTEESKHG